MELYLKPIIKLKAATHTNNGRPFTDDEKEFVRANYHHMTATQLAVKLGRSKSSISNLRHKMKLSKTENVSKFKPGSTPWNKGTNYFPKGSEKTRFKPGNIPHNTQPPGTRRWDKKANLYFIKFPDGKWNTLYRYIWEQHNGPIPAGHVIRLKAGGSKENPSINDLMMLTYANNMQHNRNRKKAAETIKRINRRKRARQHIESYGYNFISKL